MRQVWKYELPLADEIRLELPLGSKILHFGNQRDRPCIWALVSTDQKGTGEYRFRLAGTGHEIRENMNQLEYIGTALFKRGALVLHLFELIS
jgi:hypothetical protein